MNIKKRLNPARRQPQRVDEPLRHRPADPRRRDAPRRPDRLPAVGDSSQAKLTTVDLGTLAVTGSLALPAGSHRLAASNDGKLVYVTAGTGNGRVRHDRSRQRRDHRPGRASATTRARSRSSPNGQRAYVTVGSRGLAIVDLKANRLVRTVRVGRNPIDVAVHPSGSRAYALNKRSRSISVVDTFSAPHAAHDQGAQPRRQHLAVSRRQVRAGRPGQPLAQAAGVRDRLAASASRASRPDAVPATSRPPARGSSRPTAAAARSASPAPSATSACRA